MLHVDPLKFESAYRKLLYVTHHRAPEEQVSFTTGLWESEEGYKRKFWSDARAAMELDTWPTHKNDFAYIILKSIQPFGVPMPESRREQNLVSYQNYTKLIEILSGNAKVQKEAAAIFYDIYFGSDDKAVFERLAKLLNGKHMNDPISVASMYFFLKNQDDDGEYRYVTARKEGTGDRLQKLGLNAACLQGCTWNGYQQYMTIIRELQTLLLQYHPETTLLDAQSFLWMLHMIDNSTPEYTEEEETFKDTSFGIVNISKVQWGNLIEKGIVNQEDAEYLAKFYASPRHASTLKRLGELENRHFSSYITPAVSIAKKVSTELALPSIPREGTDREKFYPILFLGRNTGSGHFEWQLRPELVEALEEKFPSLLEISIEMMYQQEEAKAASLSKEELLKKAAEIHNGPADTYTTKTQLRRRNALLVLAAKAKANGVCQLCGTVLDFNDGTGKPYLEVHHIIPLADDGPDELNNMTALCPNCHRKMHVVCADEDVTILQEKARAYL